MFSFSAARDELLGGVYWAEGRWFDDGEAEDAEAYVRHCPVTRHVLETDHPFFWTKVQARQGPRYRLGAACRGGRGNARPLRADGGEPPSAHPSTPAGQDHRPGHRRGAPLGLYAIMTGDLR